MTVAVAHQASSSSRTIALHEGVREAQLRGTELSVLHVVESLDLDIEDAYRHSLQDEVQSAFTEVGATDVPWQLHLATAQQNVAETILDLTGKVQADLLIIGARRRSPVGKALLGSVTQTLILQADVPVLVVKSPPAP
jgi:nucleotide-binding universal stress UspA family protein